MPRSRRRQDSEPDLNQLAYATVLRATGGAATTEAPPEKNPAAVGLGKLGGAKGGKARAAVLSPKKRTAIAKKAARARWMKP